jgi:hypothetical protein
MRVMDRIRTQLIALWGQKERAKERDEKGALMS